MIVGTSDRAVSADRLDRRLAPSTDLTVTRLNTNGTFDTSFNGTGKFFLPLERREASTTALRAADITVMPDGTLLVGGAAGPAWTSPNDGLLADLTPSGTSQCRLRHERNGGAGVQGRTYQSPARPIRLPR